MSGTEKPEFDTEDRRRVYEFIRDEGPVAPEDIRDEQLLPVTPSRYDQILAILKRDGYVTEVEGKVRDDYQPRERQEHSIEEFDVRVRQARLEDLSGLAGVIRQVIEGRTYIVGESVSDQLENVDTLLRGDAETPPTYFVALVEGEVIGWVHLEGRDVDKLDHVVYLTMGLLDEYRGLGIGSKLMDRAVTWAGKHGYDKVASNVPASNESAIDFLKETGWEQEGIRPDHYNIDGQLVGEVLLSTYP